MLNRHPTRRSGLLAPSAKLLACLCSSCNPNGTPSHGESQELEHSSAFAGSRQGSESPSGLFLPILFLLGSCQALEPADVGLGAELLEVGCATSTLKGRTVRFHVALRLTFTSQFTGFVRETHALSTLASPELICWTKASTRLPGHLLLKPHNKRRVRSGTIIASRERVVQDQGA